MSRTDDEAFAAMETMVTLLTLVADGDSTGYIATIDQLDRGELHNLVSSLIGTLLAEIDDFSARNNCEASDFIAAMGLTLARRREGL